MMRVDREVDRPIESDQADELVRGIAGCIGLADLVLVSDYNKGVCKGRHDFPRGGHGPGLPGVPVLADPVKGGDYHRYAGCACITPNRLEAAAASGMAIGTPEDGLEAARRLLKYGVESAIVTLDRDGMAWANRSGEAGLVPARPRQVCDITGAGDMVLATLGYTLAAGRRSGHGHRNRPTRRAGWKSSGSASSPSPATKSLPNSAAAAAPATIKSCRSISSTPNCGASARRGSGS